FGPTNAEPASKSGRILVLTSMCSSRNPESFGALATIALRITSAPARNAWRIPRRRDFVRQRQKEGAGASVINRSLAALRRMLKIAYEDRKLQYLPVIRLLKEPPARKGFLQTEKFE